MSLYCVILAGGEGTRFAPLSTKERPKQFLEITDCRQTMLRQTFLRILPLVPVQNIYVSTNQRYVGLVSDQLPEILPKNIIGEPCKKNTAPPIALISRLILQRDPEAVILFFPSDHFILDTEVALFHFNAATKLTLEEEVLVTFGVPPQFPSSDYGYIRKDKMTHASGAEKVHSFVEKPDLKTAEGYLQTGDTYWNSGMFAWRASVFLEALSQHAPRLFSLLQDISFEPGGELDDKQCCTYFERAESISVDYAVMEKADNVMVFPFKAGWSDVGTWKGLKDLAERYNLDLPKDIKTHLSRM